MQSPDPNPADFAKFKIGDVVVRVFPPTPSEDKHYAARPEIETWLERVVSQDNFENDQTIPLLIVGPPGTGKTALAAALSRKLKLPFYRWSAHCGLRADELLAMARLRQDQQVEIVLSPFASGFVSGPSMCFLDEIDKADSDALAALLPLLDGARSIPSALGAVALPVHPGARFCFAANEISRVPLAFRSRVCKIDVPYLPIEKTLEIVARSGAIPRFEEVSRVFRAAWLSNAPKERPSPSLREAVRGCRLLLKEATHRPAAMTDSVFHQHVIRGVLEI